MPHPQNVADVLLYRKTGFFINRLQHNGIESQIAIRSAGLGSKHPLMRRRQRNHGRRILITKQRFAAWGQHPNHFKWHAIEPHHFVDGFFVGE